MRKSTLIISILVAIVLISTMVFTLVSCFDTSGGDDDTPIENDNNKKTDKDKDKDKDSGTTPTPTPPTPPTPGGGSGSNPSGDTAGTKTTYVGPYVAIAQLIGGLKTSQGSGKYKTLNLYADIEKRSAGEAESTKKRLIFRTNVDSTKYEPITFANQYEFSNYINGAVLYVKNEKYSRYDLATEYSAKEKYYYRIGDTSTYVKLEINSQEEYKAAIQGKRTVYTYDTNKKDYVSTTTYDAANTYYKVATDKSNNQYVLKMIEFKNENNSSESGEESGESGDSNDPEGPSTSLLSFENEEGTLDVGASVTEEELEEEHSYEANGNLLWAVYIVDGKMFLDKGEEEGEEDQPLIYFEDFDMDYVFSIATNLLESLSDGKYDGQLNGDLFKMLDDLLGVITINKILGLLVTFVFPSSAKLVTVTDAEGNQTTTYTLEIGVNSLIAQIKGLVSLVFSLGLFELPFDLQLDPLMTFLNDVTPKMVVNIVGTTYKAKGETTYVTQEFGLEVTDNNPKSETYNQLLLDFSLSDSIVYTDDPANLDIPDKVFNAANDSVEFESFGLTNIALSLDLLLNSHGDLDVGAVINSAAGKKILPTDTIVVDAATGIRLELALDADLNYGKKVYTDADGKEKLVDNNYIVLELYLIGEDNEGNTIVVDEEPLIAVYYMNGGLYANLGHLLERYYSGSNIKINLEGIPDVIQYVIDLVSNALDNVFIDTLKWDDWVTWNDLWLSKHASTPSGAGESISTSSEGGILTASEVGVVALSSSEEESGKFTVSTNWVTFLKAVGYVVGLGDVFTMNDEKTAIQIVVNTILFNGIKALASSLDFELPDGLIAILSINFDENTGKFDSISVSAALDDRVGYKDIEGNWYLGKKLLYNPLIFTNDGETFYETAELTTVFNLPADDEWSDYDIVFVKDNKFYLDKNFTQEIVIGYTASGKPGAYKEGVATGIKQTQRNQGDTVIYTLTKGDISIETTKPISAYIYRDHWVVGYGLENYVETTVYDAEKTYYNRDWNVISFASEKEFSNYLKEGNKAYLLEKHYIDIEPTIEPQGLTAMISIHDVCILKTSDYLDKFNQDMGGTNYKGYYGASSNIEGYILSKTHTRQRVELTSTSVGTYYKYDGKKYTKVEIGNDPTKGQITYAEAIEGYSGDFFQIVEMPYVSSISQWINTLLAGTFFSLNLVIDFSAGKYNLAPLVSIFLPEMKDKALIWEFTGDFTLDASLNIGISLNKEDPTKSTLVLELVANKDIKISESKEPGKVVALNADSEGKYFIYDSVQEKYVVVDVPKGGYDSTKTYYEYHPEMLLFEKGKTILGVYGVGTKVYAELENVKLLNITLPNLSMELDYTTLLYSLIGDKEIYDLTFNIMDLINGSDEDGDGDGKNKDKDPSTASTSEEGKAPITTDNLADQFDGDISQALALFIDSDVVAVSVTIAGLQKLLTELNVNLEYKGNPINLSDIMKLSVALVLNRTSGVYLDIGGALCPKYNEDTKENNYDDNLFISLRLATDEEYELDGEGNPIIDSETGKKVIKRVATPVQIGDVEELLKHYEPKFEKLAADTDKYYDDLIQAILHVIGDLQLTITIDASVLNSVWDINKIIDTIVADRADTFALPINVIFDDWETEVQLAVQWYLDLENFKNTQILIEIRYEGNVWIGVYVYNNSIILDLNGIGLFDVELTNLKAISNLGSVIQSLLGSIGDLSLTGLVGGLIEDLVNKEDDDKKEDGTSNQEELTQTEGEASQTEGETSEAGDETSEGEEGNGTKASNDLLSMILNAVALQNTTIGIHLTADVFEAIFRELLGFSMYLEFDIAGEVDIKEGRLGIDVGVERSVFADITLQLAAGERGAFKFEKNLDEIPDWNAVSGSYLIKSILKNLELGLYIDLDQYTSTTGKAVYTRVYIEKLKNKVTLDSTDGKTASKGSLLVTVADIDETEFNNAGHGSKTPLLYAELNFTSGKLVLTFASGLLVANVIGIKIDIGNMIGQINIDLDLVSMLSGTLDDLLAKISDLINGLVKPADSAAGEIIEAVTENITQNQEEEEQTATVEETELQLIEVKSSYEWNDSGNVKSASNEGKYYLYNGTVYVIDATGTPTALSKYTMSTKTDLPLDANEMVTNSITGEKSYKWANYFFVYSWTEEFTETQESTGKSITYTETYYDYYICKAGTGLERRNHKIYKASVVNGISGFFSGLDIISLFDMLTLYLSCDKTSKVGVLNADITVNTYQINYLIDHLMYYIFGPETILNLPEMTKINKLKKDAGWDGTFIYFTNNALADVHWNRQDSEALWNDLWDVVKNQLLGDLLDALGYGALTGGAKLVSGAIQDTLRGIIERFVPFAVTNETHLGLNLVRGQLTNIYLTNEDQNKNIYDSDGNAYTFLNGTKEVKYTAGSRQDYYFTNLHIFNTSPSVGDEQYTGVDGAITWDNTPTTITYNPYMYANDKAAAKALYNSYFGSGHTATFQRATELYKADLSFKFRDSISAAGISANETISYSDSSVQNLEKLLAYPGTYYITATAPFSGNTRTLTIKLVVQADADNGGAITLMDTQTMFVYQSMPAYIFMYTADGLTRRIPTSDLKFATEGVDGTINLSDESIWLDAPKPWRYVAESEDGDWEETVYVKFPNGTIKDMVVHYKNSTITSIILDGSGKDAKENALKDNTINVDLYQFNTSDTLANYTPEKLFFTYYDMTAGNLPVEWTTEAGTDPAELFKRVQYIEKGTKNSLGFDILIDANGTEFYRDATGAAVYADSVPEENRIFGSVKGASYKLYGTVAKGTDIEQTVEITFNVPERKVTSVSFGSRTNILDVQPYEYYLYLIDHEKYEQFNPYKDVITVNYDQYQEQVHVVWENIATNINYSWNIVKTETSTCQVLLDPDWYPSGDIFTWTQDVDVTVSRNQIQGIYFDKELTQSTLLIDPYAYHNATTAFDYYPTKAWVKFTNGKVIEMPIAFDKSEIESLNVDYATDYTQFTVYIGVKIGEYYENGKPVPFEYGGEENYPFYQDYTINAKVDGTAIKGISMKGGYNSTEVYKIDPIDVDFLNESPFPTEVRVIYEDEDKESDNMKVVKWEIFENNEWVAIDLKTYKFDVEQQTGKQARCYLTNDLYFVINYEVLDRTSSMMVPDTSSITSKAINPYAYTVKADGTITYDIFEETMNVQYATEFTLTLIDLGEDGVYGENPANENKNDDITVSSKTYESFNDLKVARRAIKDEYLYDAATGLYTKGTKKYKLIEETEYKDYTLPVTWDTSTLNISKEGGSETVYFSFGKDNYYIEQFVDVEFAPKNIAYIETTNYILELYADKSDKLLLKNSEIASQSVTKTQKVYFTDGTYEYLDIVYDLSTVLNSQGKATKTQFTYTEAEVGTTTQSYYVLGRYDAVKLRGNGMGYAQYKYTYIAISDIVIDNTYYYLDSEGVYQAIVASTTNISNQETYYTRAEVDYYEINEIAQADMQADTIYYIESDNSFVPVWINAGKTNIDSALTYYTVTLAPSVNAETSGTYYTLNDNVSDREAYVKVDLSNTSSKYNSHSSAKYYTLSISQTYMVTATIGQASPALTQTLQVRTYVLG